MWRLAFGHHGDRTPTHGYAVNREGGTRAVAKSWRLRMTITRLCRSVSLRIRLSMSAEMMRSCSASIRKIALPLR
jgi:hypothetical protein